MKSVVQLNEENYFVGLTFADESPLEPGVFLIPGGAIDIDAPIVPEGKRAKWNGEWVLEDIPAEVSPELPTPTEDDLEEIAARVALRASAEAKTDAIEHAKSLGFTDEMINVMYPSLVS
jgi:hypothetical protein